MFKIDLNVTISLLNFYWNLHYLEIVVLSKKDGACSHSTSFLTFFIEMHSIFFIMFEFEKNMPLNMLKELLFHEVLSLCYVLQDFCLRKAQRRMGGVENGLF